MSNTTQTTKTQKDAGRLVHHVVPCCGKRVWFHEHDERCPNCGGNPQASGSYAGTRFSYFENAR